MAIDIKNILQLVQTKIAAVDANTSTEDIGYLLNLAKRVDGSMVRSYDSDGLLPDAALTTERLAYITSTGIMRFNNGQWDAPDEEVYPVVVPANPFGGTISGYTSGGSASSNVIDKFPFASDGNATDVGDLTVARQNSAGQSSDTFGYTSGGTAAPLSPNTIDKFSFASDGNATDVGDLTVARGAYVTPAGQSSETFGYTSGGSSVDVIDKFAFTSDGNATDVGNLSTIRGNLSGQSSPEYGNGYTAGGNNPVVDTIDKFPFAADGNATDVANLTLPRYFVSGQSSSTHGYASGGYFAPSQRDVIDKFSFASDADATDVGNLSIAKYDTAGQSSTTFGYISGGNPAPTGQIEKFSFTSDGNTTSVGNLSSIRSAPTGQQV